MGGLQHSGCILGTFCFAVLHHLSETWTGCNPGAGEEGVGGDGDTQEVPPGVPLTAVSLSAVS